MPHLVLSDREIDEQHPRIVAPEDEHGDDPAIDAADATLQVGQKIAEEIRDNMRIEGRRRRRASATPLREGPLLGQQHRARFLTGRLRA